MSNFIKDLSEVKKLNNASLTLFIDKNDGPCFILKDNSVDDISNIQLYNFNTNSEYRFMAKNNTNFYNTFISKKHLDESQLNFFENNSHINIILFSEDCSSHQVQNTFIRNITQK